MNNLDPKRKKQQIDGNPALHAEYCRRLKPNLSKLIDEAEKNRQPPMPREDNIDIIQECKECAAMADHINQLSNMLKSLQDEYSNSLALHKEEYDKMLSLNKQLIALQEQSANEDENTKKILEEKEQALKKLEKEEANRLAQEKLNRLAAPKKPALKRQTNGDQAH